MIEFVIRVITLTDVTYLLTVGVEGIRRFGEVNRWWYIESIDDDPRFPDEIGTNTTRLIVLADIYDTLDAGVDEYLRTVDTRERRRVHHGVTVDSRPV